MKFFFTAIVFSLSFTAFALVPQGKVTLNGQALDVTISSKSITIGKSEFKISGNEGDTIEGVYLVKSGQKTLIDKKISFYQKSSLNDGIETWQNIVDNSQEVACTKKSNAFILITDDITNQIVGNCALIK